MSDIKINTKENGLEQNSIGEASQKLLKKADIILFVVVLIVAFGALGCVMLTKEAGKKVDISVDGEIVKVLSIEDDCEYMVMSDAGTNLVVIEDGRVTVREADCSDGVCVKHSSIGQVGETIICLPHKLVVEVIK